MCRDRCRSAYIDCCRLREQAEALKFPDADQAANWLKEHREEVLVGAVVVIAGVTFIVAVVGSGGFALVLVPVVLMVSDEVAPSELQSALVNP